MSRAGAAALFPDKYGKDGGWGERFGRVVAGKLIQWTVWGVVVGLCPAGVVEGGIWEAHVAPVFQESCIKCHGGVKRKGGLDLRSEEALLEGGDSGAVVVAGKPDESLLIEVLHPGADPHMPPKGEPLGEEAVEFLRAWISGMGDGSVEEVEVLGWEVPEGTGTAAAVDGFLGRAWERDGVEVAAASDDRVFVRRVYLDLVGRVPSRGEVRAFLTRGVQDRRRVLVEELSGGAESARHFAEVFNVVLLGREGGRSKRRSEREEKKWMAYLERVFAENRPWDRVVSELILARPPEGDEVERGASWFLLEHGDDHQELVRTVGPALFGRDVKCAQCHDHPVVPEIKQAHYWGLVAYFNRSYRVDAPGGVAMAEKASGGYDKYANVQGGSFESGLDYFSGVRFEEPGGRTDEEVAEAYLVVPPQELLAPTDEQKKKKGRVKVERVPVPKFSRREALVEVAVGRDTAYAEALVNRIWGWLFGRGIVHPVDRIDSVHPASQPELMAWLVEDFVANGCDVRRLVRELVLTRAYALESLPQGGRPEEGAFACFSPKALTAEQMARSVLVVTGQPLEEGVVEALRLKFVERFPDVFPDAYAPDAMRAMFMTNSPVVDGVLDGAPLLGQLDGLSSDAAVVNEAFSAVLGRDPDGGELVEAVRYLGARADRRVAAVRQLCWALLAGGEFRFNH